MKGLLSASCMAALLLAPRCGWEPWSAEPEPHVVERRAMGLNGTPEEQWAATRRDMCEAGAWICEADGGIIEPRAPAVAPP